MKKLPYISLLTVLLFACDNNQRYTQQSAEINTFKSFIENYINGDWDSYESYYAEGAKIYFNATEANPSTIQQIIAQQKMELESMSFYTIDRENEAVEMVLDDRGETWVNYWSVWKRTLTANGKTYETPIHFTAKFVDGKIVESLGYWDNAPLQVDIMAMQMQIQNAGNIPSK